MTVLVTTNKRWRNFFKGISTEFPVILRVKQIHNEYICTKYHLTGEVTKHFRRYAVQIFYHRPNIFIVLERNQNTAMSLENKISCKFLGSWTYYPNKTYKILQPYSRIVCQSTKLYQTYPSSSKMYHQVDISILEVNLDSVQILVHIWYLRELGQASWQLLL